MNTTNTSPTRAKTGDALETSKSSPAAATPDLDSDNSASTLVESPVLPGDAKSKKHDFPEGGGSGGAEAYRHDQRHRHTE